MSCVQHKHHLIALTFCCWHGILLLSDFISRNRSTDPNTAKSEHQQQISAFSYNFLDDWLHILHTSRFHLVYAYAAVSLTMLFNQTKYRPAFTFNAGRFAFQNQSSFIIFFSYGLLDVASNPSGRYESGIYSSYSRSMK